MSNAETRRERNIAMMKNRLLKEFEIEDKLAQELAYPTPTTESMRKSIMGLGFHNDKNLDYYVQKQALENTRMSLNKLNDKNVSIKIGAKPCARDGHSAWIDSNKLYIFAGDRHRMSFNDLYVLNLDYLSKINT